MRRRFVYIFNRLFETERAVTRECGSGAKTHWSGPLKGRHLFLRVGLFVIIFSSPFIQFTVLSLQKPISYFFLFCIYFDSFSNINVYYSKKKNVDGFHLIFYYANEFFKHFFIETFMV